MYACIHSARPAGSALLECASGFAPTTDAIELCDERTVVFRVEGLGLLYGPLQAVAEAITLRARAAGLDAKAVIAHSVDAARLLVRRPDAESVEVVSIDETASRVGVLNVKDLGLTREVEEVFALWGIKTLGEFAALPEKGLVQRFGPEAVRWHRLARGALQRPLITLEPDRTIADELDLDYEIDLLDALMFGIGRLLNSLCERLIESGLATDEVTVTLKLADGASELPLLQHAAECSFVLRLPLPLDSARPLLRVIRFELEKNPPAAPIRAISISMHTVIPRRLQLGLFIPASPEPATLELTLSRLRSLVGEENVGVPELLDSHHPQPFGLGRSKPISIEGSVSRLGEKKERRVILAVRYLRPSMNAEMDIFEGRPTRLRTRKWEKRVMNAAGPWHLSGDWWGDVSWDREEWDVALCDGIVYRVYRNEGPQTDQWIIEGVYD
jgi:protein ImuB